MTQGELQRLLNAQSGEGLLFVSGESAWFTARNMASQPENDICSTTTTEVAEIKRRRVTEAEAEAPTSGADHLLSFDAGGRTPPPVAQVPPPDPYGAPSALALPEADVSGPAADEAGPPTAPHPQDVAADPNSDFGDADFDDAPFAD